MKKINKTEIHGGGWPVALLMGNAEVQGDIRALFEAIKKMRLSEALRYLEQHPPSPESALYLMLCAARDGFVETKHRAGKHAAEKRHGQPGGSRDKVALIRTAWASGKYSSRDRCAEKECAALNMSFSAARKALRNTPDPRA